MTPRTTHVALLGIAMLVLLAACVPQNVVKPGQPLDVGARKVETLVPWTAFPRQGHQRLTRDGLQLNKIQIVTAMPPDRHVLSLMPHRRGRAGAAFRSGMDTLDLAELMADALRAGGFGRVEIINFGADSHRGQPAIRTELALVSEQGLEYRGLFVGSSNGQRLDYLLYLAPTEFFFDRDLPSAEQLIAQLR